MTGDFRNWCATVDQVPRSFLLQAAMHSNIQFVVDSLSNVKPVQIVVQQRWLTPVELDDQKWTIALVLLDIVAVRV